MFDFMTRMRREIKRMLEEQVDLQFLQSKNCYSRLRGRDENTLYFCEVF
jgi:hypothetical protein